MRKFFWGVVCIGYVLALGILSIVSLAVWWTAGSAIFAFLDGLFKGFSPVGGAMAFVFTLIAAWGSWKCFEFVRDVFIEFRLHLAARKGSAGSS
jgi:hypothetical protein